jgi:V/A-type H+-transporting ATPase subunit A
LQQNTFDDVDAACSEKRQCEVFDVIMTVMDGKFTFEEKEDARSYFNRLRQLFVDWNYFKEDSEDYQKQKKAIDAALKEAIDA